MKVERARTDGSETNKPETKASNSRVQPATNQLKTQTVEGANQGAFSKALDVARETSQKGRTDNNPVDADNDNSVDKTGDGKNNESIETKNAKRDDQKNFSGESDGEDDSASVAVILPASTDKTGDTNIAIPQARSILHIADLERIVSVVRSDSFAGTKQVTIDLKNSVLDGLRIQLTLTEQGTIKAEFIALNEQIRKQLHARTSELQSVLKDRSIKCSEIKISILTPDKENVSMNRNDD